MGGKMLTTTLIFEEDDDNISLNIDIITENGTFLEKSIAYAIIEGIEKWITFLQSKKELEV
jgi:hypothetical protein